MEVIDKCNVFGWVLFLHWSKLRFCFWSLTLSPSLMEQQNNKNCSCWHLLWDSHANCVNLLCFRASTKVSLRRWRSVFQTEGSDAGRVVVIILISAFWLSPVLVWGRTMVRFLSLRYELGPLSARRLHTINAVLSECWNCGWTNPVKVCLLLPSSERHKQKLTTFWGKSHIFSPFLRRSGSDCYVSLLGSL